MASYSLLQRRFAPRKVVRLPSLFPVLFILVFPTAFFLCSRMTGRYLLPFCKKLFYVSAHTCPFRQPVGWHFSQGKASHSLLQRRSAPRKVVLLLPDKRGRLTFCTFPFYVKHTETACISCSVLCVLIWPVNTFIKLDCFFLSVSFPRMRREVPSFARR